MINYLLEKVPLQQLLDDWNLEVMGLSVQVSISSLIYVQAVTYILSFTPFNPLPLAINNNIILLVKSLLADTPTI